MKKKIKLTMLCLFIFVYAGAQSGKLFSADMELSNSLINQVYQDRNGIIWIATEDGLNRYDGSKFTIYKHDKDNPNSPLNNFIRVFLQVREGHFFIGYFNGLQTYDYASDTFKVVPLVLDNGETFNAHVITICQRKTGEVLIGTSSHGIFSVKFNENEIYAKQNTTIIPDNEIVSIYEDKNEKLWVNTENKGLFRIDKNNKLKNYFGVNETPGVNISDICEDNEGNIYIGSMNSGLYVYNETLDTFKSIPYPANPRLPIKTLYLSNKNELYIGTEGNGMKTFDPIKKKITEGNFNVTTFDFSKAKIHSIMEDQAGNTWLGIFQKGVMILPARSNKFHYTGYKSVTKNSIGSNCVMSILKDHQGTIWIGTDSDGIYAIDSEGKQLARYEAANKANSVPSTIMSIYEDSKQDLWLGSYLNGLSKLNRATGHCQYVRNLVDRNSNPVQRIYCLAEDEDKNLWIGTMGSGLYSMNLDTYSITQYNYIDSETATDNNLVHSLWIDCLLITSNGKLYLGTYDGLGCMDLKTKDFSSTYGTHKLISGKVIYSLYEDKDGTVWMGTSEGLCYIEKDTNEIVSYTMSDGLPSNIICAIKGDNSGNLWISTNYGISRMDLETKNFINYYSNDGLQGNEFSKGAAIADEKGHILFGGISGITSFNPREITNQEKELKVRLTDFYIHDQPVKKGMKSGKYDIIDTSVPEAQKFHLSHRDNSFTIEFSTMDFINPERITYMYSMNNNNRITMRPGTNRVTFNNLTPGKYQFQVKAKDYNAYSDIKSISIIISPPPYASVWAKTIYYLIAVLLIVLVIQQIRQRYRVKQQMIEHKHAKQMDEAKLQFFINISHEIRTPMSLILNPLRKLMTTDKDKDRQRSYSVIRRNTERILHLINQLMDIRKIDEGQMLMKFQQIEIVGFIKEIYTMFEDPAEAKQIELRFCSEVDQLNTWVDLKYFDKIIVNVLSNAIKYTPEKGKISISLLTGNDKQATNELRNYLEIIICDTGIGINENEIERIFERFYQTRQIPGSLNQGTGIGLHLTRSIVELHHGTIKAENNKEERGTRFVIRLPIGKEHLKPEEIDEEPAATSMHVHIIPPVSDLLEGEEDKARPKSKRYVLVADDDDEIRKYICRELSPDYHTIECKNGKEALSMVLQKAPDLIISDVMMPEMDGISLCRKIKQNVNINHIPIILLTGKTKEEDNLEGLDIGADAYMLKPFNIEILKSTVLNIIKNREILKNTFSGSQQQEDKMQKIKIKSADDKLLEKVMKAINENISNPQLNVEMIAGRIGISRVHLHRKLKELTNQSTRDLIRNIRLKQAATLLSAKHQNITEVAAATGFTNLTYFSNAFKELYGVPPTTYMEKQLTMDNGQLTIDS